MFSFLKKKLGAASTELKKVENTDIMEAIVGGSLLVAAADGEISDDEMIALDKQLSANPSLEAFGSQIGKEINRFEKLLASGFRIGKLKILREIEDIKSNPDDAEEVFINMLSIAEADGTVDDNEKAILVEVGNKLGIRLSDYGL